MYKQIGKNHLKIESHPKGLCPQQHPLSPYLQKRNVFRMIKIYISSAMFFSCICGAGGQKKAKANMIFTSLIIYFYIHITARNTVTQKVDV